MVINNTQKVVWFWEQKPHTIHLRSPIICLLIPLYLCIQANCVDLEVWSKLAKCTRVMRITSKYACDFDCDWQRVNMFSHCVTLSLIRVLLSQIMKLSPKLTKYRVLVVMECKRANVIYVYKLIYLLHTSRSTECIRPPSQAMGSDYRIKPRLSNLAV